MKVRYRPTSRNFETSLRKQGTTYTEKGDIAYEFYVVLGGEVEVLREQDGRESQMVNLRVGEYFGEMSLLDNAPHSSSVRARTPAEILVMSGEDFLALASSSSLFGDMLREVVQRRADENMPNLSSEKTEEKRTGSL